MALGNHNKIIARDKSLMSCTGKTILLNMKQKMSTPAFKINRAGLIPGYMKCAGTCNIE